MNIRSSVLAAAFVISVPLAAQAQSQTRTPTIPETQLEPRTLATPYEFAAVASSLNAFQIKASEHAVKKASDPDVKTLAADLATSVAQAQSDLAEASRTDEIEIAPPAPDGEQDRLIAQMEGAEGEAFDVLYVKSQVFAYQRLIPVVSGYAAKQSALGKYAAAALPRLNEQYAKAVALAERLGVGNPAQEPAEGSDSTSATK